MKIGFTGLLTLIFIALKLTGYIAWSWLWVLAPAWIGAAIVIVVLLLGLLISAVVALGIGKGLNL